MGLFLLEARGRRFVDLFEVEAVVLAEFVLDCLGLFDEIL